MNKPYFNNYELYVLLDAIYNRKLEAKMELEKIEEGKIDKSGYEYWHKIYFDCDNIHKKLVYHIIK